MPHMLLATDLQMIALRIIVNYNQLHGKMPSADNLAMAMAVTRTAAVNHLKALEKKGYIRRAAGQARAITILKTAQ